MSPTWCLTDKELILSISSQAVQVVATRASAKQSLLQEIPSILFLDNHLPDGFGLDFIKYVKSVYPKVKIVMITAHDGLAERQLCA